jgi:hypothetical protein
MPYTQATDAHTPPHTHPTTQGGILHVQYCDVHCNLLKSTPHIKACQLPMGVTPTHCVLSIYPPIKLQAKLDCCYTPQPSFPAETHNTTLLSLSVLPKAGLLTQPLPFMQQQFWHAQAITQLMTTPGFGVCAPSPVVQRHSLRKASQPAGISSRSRPLQRAPDRSSNNIQCQETTLLQTPPRDSSASDLQQVPDVVMQR